MGEEEQPNVKAEQVKEEPTPMTDRSNGSPPASKPDSSTKVAATEPSPDSSKVKVLSRDGGTGKGNKPQNINSGKCTDCLFIIVFFAFWIGMVIVAIVGFATGDIRRLLFATDYLGNTCGTCVDGTKSCGPSIYYPRPGLDALMQGLNPLTGLFPSGLGSVTYFGICVDLCPSPGGFVCTYDVQKHLTTAYRTAGARSHVLQQCAQEMNSASLGLSNNFGLDGLDGDCEMYMRGCYFVTQSHTNLLWRCLPQKELNLTHEFSCFYPRFQDDAQSMPMPATICPDEVGNAQLSPSCADDICFARTGSKCLPNDRCISLLDKETRYNVASAAGGGLSGNLVAKQLGSWTNTVSRSFGDLQHTWWTVLTVGVLGGLVLGFLWILILEYTVTFFVYLMIVLSLLVQLLVILLCFIKAGKLGTQITWLAAQTGSEAIVSSFSASDASQPLWFFFGVCLSCLAIAYLLVLIIMRRKIQLAIGVLSEASRAIENLKSVMIMPMITGLCILVTGLYGVGMFGYIYTAGYQRAKTLSSTGIKSGLASGASSLVASYMTSSRIYTDLGSTTNASAADVVGVIESLGRRQTLTMEQLVNSIPPNYELATIEQTAERVRLLADVNVTQMLEVGLISVVTNTGTSFMILYHVFGCLWTIQVFSGVNLLTISRAVSRWYWIKENGPQPMIPVVTAYRQTLLKNFGSVCLGALFIAIMQLIRILVYYVVKNAQRLSDDNSVVKIVLRVLQCCLWCFEKMLKYVTTLAYIMVGMYGCSFCIGAGKAVRMIVANMGRLGTVHFISKLINILSILVITMGCVAIEFMWLDNDPRFLNGGDNEINSMTLSVVLTGCSAFFIASCFMQVYSITVDTILLCFCVDIELNRDTKEFYMGTRLRKLFSRKKRSNSNKKGKQNSEPNKGNGSATVVPT